MLTVADRGQLAELGIPLDEAERQLRLFAAPPPAIRIDRPCTLGDGIQALTAEERTAARAAYATAAAAGRLRKFVPASGAATRMFQALLAVRGECSRAVLARRTGDVPAARETLAFVEHVDRFAFADALRGAVAAAGHDPDRVLRGDDLGPLLEALLEPAGLDYAALPKALLLFHRYPEGSRSAFEEHLDEGAAYARDAERVARLHFTVSPEHRAAFDRTLGAVRAACERRQGARLEVTFSAQKRATDTLAAEADNRPFRTDDGRLLLRPGGHGALIENLNDLAADVVFVKTIDNIQPEHLRAPALEWLRLLTGHLVVLQTALCEHLASLRAGGAGGVAAARGFAATLGADLGAAADAAAAAAALDRPLRICGVVRNTGEPGGGPFWVREPGGHCSRQIVESAQVDQHDDRQRAAFAAATHFNPVFMACGVRDASGRPHDLRRFVDPSAVFIARKSMDGRPLQALERPGLWNGAMARWHTVFVEVPLDLFTPVKTINDLLRPAHQPPAAQESRRSTDARG